MLSHSIEISCRNPHNIPLLALTHGQNDGQRNKYTHCMWAGGTFFPVVLLCISVLVLAGNSFWCTYVLRVQYSCGVMLIFLVLAGNSFWFCIRTHLLRVGWRNLFSSCAVVCQFFGSSRK